MRELRAERDLGRSFSVWSNANASLLRGSRSKKELTEEALRRRQVVDVDALAVHVDEARVDLLVVSETREVACVTRERMG